MPAAMHSRSKILQKTLEAKVKFHVDEVKIVLRQAPIVHASIFHIELHVLMEQIIGAHLILCARMIPFCIGTIEIIARL